MELIDRIGKADLDTSVGRHTGIAHSLARCCSYLHEALNSVRFRVVRYRGPGDVANTLAVLESADAVHAVRCVAAFFKCFVLTCK